jgi:hypothetical protein
MTPAHTKQMLDTIAGQVFGYKNPYSPEEFMRKFAFDVPLPVEVNDAFDGQPTWSQSANPTKYLSMKNARKLTEKKDWLGQERSLHSVEDMLQAWNEINYTTTERQIESLNVAESDNVYNSENIYRSQDIIQSKNILFSDGLMQCEFVAAGQRSRASSFCIRLEDSKDCSNSFSVAWSSKIVNCMFIQDCGDMYESMFCANIRGKRFCIANRQYQEAEYRKLKDLVVRWILTS